MAKRADILLVERGLAASRTQAQRWIEAGRVRADGQVVARPGQKIDEHAEIAVRADAADRYVSRGGVKLAAALERCAIDVRGLTAIDVGASTGGFTDCLLQAGAARVVCVDVGHDQLAASLRADARVINCEGINARELPDDLLQYCEGGFGIAVMDVSFISQTKILPALVRLLKPGAYLISLVKPQFEVGRAGIGKGGIVRDERLYAEVRARVEACCSVCGLAVLDYFDSPITGGDGNREFLMVAQKVAPPAAAQ